MQRQRKFVEFQSDALGIHGLNLSAESEIYIGLRLRAVEGA